MNPAHIIPQGESPHQEEENEDGGVPLPSLYIDQMNLEHEYASSSSSTSILSQLTLDTAQPSLDDSDTTSSLLPISSDHHGLLSAVEDAGAPELGEMSSSEPEDSPNGQEQAHTHAHQHHEEAADGTLGQENGPSEAHGLEESDAHHVALTQPQISEAVASEVLVSPPAPQAQESNPNNMPAQSPHDAFFLLPAMFQIFPPKSDNHSCDDFMQLWKQLSVHWGQYPSIDYTETDPEMDGVLKVTTTTMTKKSCDIQGMRWSHYGTSRDDARAMRRMTVTNFGHMPEIHPEQPREAYATPPYSACFKTAESPALSVIDDFFRFQETKRWMTPQFAHNQLRHCLCASSTNAVYFFNHGDPLGFWQNPGHRHITCLNVGAGTVKNVMDVSVDGQLGDVQLSRIACMSASHGLLLAGGLYEGNYAMKSLTNTGTDAGVRGSINQAVFGAAGINHIHTFLHRRSGLPHAVFCANDCTIRVVDCNTQQRIYDQTWPAPVNCSTTSPDGRLRIHVSDDPWPVVSDAETGRVIARLFGHKDHGFACDWSPDGITMATGHEDGIVHIWDARKMKHAVHSLPAEMCGIRSLKFSPLGAGHPVLVMAEPVDFVSIVDARTFRSKQDIEFYGEISGITMPPDGGSLFIGNADPKRGGIMEFGRTGYAGTFKHRNIRCSQLHQRKSQKRQAIYNASPEDSGCDDSIEEASTEATLKRKWKLDEHDASTWQIREYDWASQADMDNDLRTVLTRKQRWRRNLGLDRVIL